jgi:hypothetical protein
VDPETPNGFQPSRVKTLNDRVATLGTAGLRKLLRQLTLQAIADGRRVFLVTSGSATLPLNFVDAASDTVDGQSLKVTTVAEWSEPGPLLKIDRHRAPPDDADAKWRLIEVSKATK